MTYKGLVIYFKRNKMERGRFREAVDITNLFFNQVIGKALIRYIAREARTVSTKDAGAEVEQLGFYGMDTATFEETAPSGNI
jgi:hypothetical protein